MATNNITQKEQTHTGDYTHKTKGDNMFIMKIVGMANGNWCGIAGTYLKEMDFEAHQGRGFLLSTPNKKDAKVFKDNQELIKYWRTTSKTQPLRPDGYPNRPLTAFNITIETVGRDQ